MQGGWEEGFGGEDAAFEDEGGAGEGVGEVLPVVEGCGLGKGWSKEGGG